MDVSAVQAFTPEALAKPGHLFPVGDKTRWARRRSVGGYGGGDQVWRGTNESSDASVVVSIQDVEADWSLTIENEAGKTLATFELPKEAGVHHMEWDLRADAKSEEARAEGRRGGRVSEGTYTAVLRKGDAKKAQRQTFRIRRDPMLNGASPAEMAGESVPEVRD